MYKLRKLNVEKIVSTEAKKSELQAKGFKLVEDEKESKSLSKPLDSMTVDELKGYAAYKDIDISGLTKKDEILAKIKGAEQENK